MQVSLPAPGACRYNIRTMLSSFSKNPQEAVDYQWPEFQAPRMQEVAVPDVPGAEGFSRFDQAAAGPKEAPKPVVQKAVFQELKPIQPE
jgi:hypothetical protein